MNKVMQGVEVYEVGKEQLWAWCQHQGRMIDGETRPHMFCNADSLRKGLYVVVEQSAKFGQVAKPVVVFSGSRVRALELALTLGTYAMASVDDGSKIASEYEVWHIVDDGELWDEWEYRAALAFTLDDADFDELADDAYSFGDCWESCIEVCTPHFEPDAYHYVYASIPSCDSRVLAHV